MSDLDDAEGWIIAQLRGNTDVSDDRCLHIALASMEQHYGLPDRGKVGAYRRLCALSEHVERFTPRGRAVLVGLWVIRLHTWLYANVEDFDELSAWSLITDAQVLEGVRS
jgi:hypothetical protein